MEKLLVFDGDFLLYYSTCPIKLTQEVTDEEGNIIYIPLKDENSKQLYRDRTLEECIIAVDDIMHNIFIKTSIFNYIGYLGGSKCFRHTVSNSYKANRINLVKPKFIDAVREYIISHYGFIRVNGIEADDAVNIVKNQLVDNYEEIVIVSPDKDILKCVEGRHFNPKKMEEVYTSKEEAEYNFWVSMIVGDTVDGIKGIPGRGIKYAENYLKNLDAKDYSQAVYDAYYLNDCLDYNTNYKLLKLLESHTDFKLPEPNEIQKYNLPMLEEIELDEVYNVEEDNNINE